MITKVITKLGPNTMTILLLGARLVITYCLKSKAILKSSPKIRVYLVSNSCWVLSSKTKIFLVGLIFPINLMVLVFLVDLIDLVAPIDPIKPIKLIGLVDRFLVPKPNSWRD